MEMTPEEAERAFALELGYAMIGIVAGVKRLRHVTLSGHLHYQHADEMHPGTVNAGLTQWLKWITAFGRQARDDIGEPDAFVDCCERIAMLQFSRMLEGALEKTN
jgi:hypothetical protein